MIDVTKIAPREPEPLYEPGVADMKRWYLDAGSPNGPTLAGFVEWAIKPGEPEAYPGETDALRTSLTEYCVGTALWEAS